MVLLLSHLSFPVIHKVAILASNSNASNNIKRMLKKYQGVKEFHMLAHIGCYGNIMVFSLFKVKVTYYHPLNLWLLGVTKDKQ